MKKRIKVKVPTREQKALCSHCPYLSTECFPEDKGVDCWGTHDIPAFFSHTGFKPLPTDKQTTEVELEVELEQIGIIEKAWRGYAAYTLPPVCGRVQYEETRKAFYGGFSAFYTFILPLAGIDDDFDPDRFVERLNKVSEEIANFVGSLDKQKDESKS